MLSSRAGHTTGPYPALTALTDAGKENLSDAHKEGAMMHGNLVRQKSAEQGRAQMVVVRDVHLPP